MMRCTVCDASLDPDDPDDPDDYHSPHDVGCVAGDPCTCDNAVCPDCCWECATTT